MRIVLRFYYEYPFMFLNATRIVYHVTYPVVNLTVF